MFAIGAPIADSRGIEGVVNGKIELDALLAILNHHSLGSSGYAYLVGDDGIIISHPDQSYNANRFQHSLRRHRQWETNSRLPK